MNGHTVRSERSRGGSDAESAPALVLAAQGGDARAVERLLEMFGPAVRAIAQGVTRDPHDAQDVVQETWLRVLLLIGQVRDPACFPGWVKTTARREALHVVQKRRRTEVGSIGPSEEDVACPDPRPDEVVARDDRDARVREAMARLPRDRAALLMETVVRQRPYIEVSRTLGRPTGSLGPLRSRYLDQLRRELIKVGVTADDYR
jgi:RNA polymerase sigma factor (sigma-70 family)